MPLESLLKTSLKKARDLTLTGLIGGYLTLTGCGIGAYAKDPRAGLVVNEVARGLWDLAVADAGKSEVKQEVKVYPQQRDEPRCDIYIGKKLKGDINDNLEKDPGEKIDFNDNGILDPGDIEGNGKKIFTKKENVRFFIYLSNEKNKILTFELFGPNYEKIGEDSEKIVDKYSFNSCEIPLAANRIGKNLAIFKLDDKIVAMFIYEIVKNEEEN